MDINIQQYTVNYINLLYIAGKGCYGLEPGDNQYYISEERKLDFIKKLIENHHESVIEHGIISIQIIGCSRSFMAQITRHRMASFSIKSQHYVNHSDFSVKDLEIDSKLVQDMYNNLIEIIKSNYRIMVNRFHVPIHIAREILPNACLTNIFMTANFREWRYIIKLRQTTKNTLEMQEFSKKIKEIFQKTIPGVFDDL